MTLFNDKYRIESARLPGWNYASNGSYFITICSYKSMLFLGRIIDGKMELSNLGTIVQAELLRSFEVRHELKCMCYVIMPNHLHLIVNLTQIELYKQNRVKKSALAPKSISTFVGGFKSSVTSKIQTISNISYKKVWHPRFYDHIIRDSDEYDFISNYIANNPATWEQDRFNQKNCGHPNNYPDN
jgi:putative transposase